MFLSMSVIVPQLHIASQESAKTQRAIRRAAMQNSVVTFTTMTGANAAASAIEALQEQEELKVTSLQEHHA
jgi:hypothetical protein